MPLPLLFILPLIGAGNTIRAAKNINDSKEINNEANSVAENARKNLELHNSVCTTALENLGNKKLFILDNSIKNFILVAQNIKNIELENTVGLNEVEKFRIDKKSFEELKKMSFECNSLFWAAGGALLAGGFAALTVASFFLGTKAKTQKENANSNLAKAKMFAEKLKNDEVVCDGIRRRSNMFYNLLTRLDSLFTPLVMQMSIAVQEHHGNYNNFTLDQKHTVAAAFVLAGTIKAVLDTPILTKDGKLTEESELLIPKIQKCINQTQQKKITTSQLHISQKQQCSNCGNVYITGTKFCTQCGTKL